MAVLRTSNLWWRWARPTLTLVAAGLLSLHSLPALEWVTAQEAPTSQWAMTNTPLSVGSDQAMQSMQMVVNTSREIAAEHSFKQVRIQNPDILKALPLEGGNRLQISAIATGVTQIDLLGADDSVHSIEVMVLGDVRELEAILRGCTVYLRWTV